MNKKKKIIMTIGMPFSGKSTIAKEYENNGWKIIERDQILEKILESKKFNQIVEEEIQLAQTAEREKVFSIKNKIAIRLLTEEVIKCIDQSESEKIFYDGTNLQKAAREGIASLDRDKYEVTAMFLDIPIEEIMNRAKKVATSNERGNKFNEGALKNIERMHNMMEEPSLSEGFSKITKIESSENKKEFKIPIK